MENKDGRNIGDSALEERHATIIRMKENGFTEKQIIAATGCSRQAIYLLWNKWKKGKSPETKQDAIAVRPRGTKFGERRTLTKQQERIIQKVIINKYPDQLKFDFALWTREAVKKLILQKFDIDMPIRSVGNYLGRWNFTPQKPVKYAWERDPWKVKEWLETAYPAIKKRAKRQKAEIFWGDETTIKAEDVRGRGYAPKGKTPIVNRTTKKENVSMVSAITNQGKVFWKLYEGSVNGERFLEFVKQLVKNKKNKIFLIVDNARTHHGKKLMEWVIKNQKRIEIYFLPPYSPDLNPDERVNADVKYGVGAKQPKRTKEELEKTTQEHMSMLKKTPERIVRYFGDPAINYAA
jgi:transposase